MSRGTLQAFAMFTRFGNTVTIVLLCIAVACGLLMSGMRWLALAWVLATGGNGLLDTVLKGVFERPRPVHDHGLVHALSMPG
ncbi:hypothetical protein [Methylibium sp.]|uniref:hypothetical protein n=1 Tax=Methylibium sp. TaxID=2067992 RepID=UPI003D0BDD76